MITDKTHVSVWGRTLDEYFKMFGLDNSYVKAKILSIADGPSTFNLEMQQLGGKVTSIDPIYNLNSEELKITFAKSYQFNKDLFYNNKQNFSFKTDNEIEVLLNKRQDTFETFLQDFEQHKSNYLFGQLPQIDFPDNSFDLCLCSNLLFIFDHIFNADFHINSIKEMLRVAKEVRVFPIYNIDGVQSNYLSDITNYLDNNNIGWQLKDNNYFVYKNGNKYLQINSATE